MLFKYLVIVFFICDKCFYFLGVFEVCGEILNLLGNLNVNVVIKLVCVMW